MTLKSIFIVGTILTVLVACSNDPLDVDISETKVDINFIDMDSAFVHSDSINLMKRCSEYKKSIKDIYEYELGHCIGIGRVSDSILYDTLSGFLDHPYTARLEARIHTKFSDKTEIRENIRNGFKHLKFHFPTVKQPKNIVFLNSVFTGSAISMEDDIAVGLERYLGPDVDVIKELPPNEFFQWIKEAMDAQFLERDVMASWIMTNVVENPNGGSLAENIVYWGKIIYFIEASFPDQEEHIIIRYSDEDYKWAVDNEYSYWEYLVAQNLLFKLDERTKMNMLKEGPFTPGLPEIGPDRLGQFLGWRMVHQYMENHSDLSLSELNNKGYNDILQEYEIED
ncbi:MAG: hypothetical protein ACI837_001204 [Crocinitomicaceae bacterium]|jgi:hypothetical protein